MLYDIPNVLQTVVLLALLVVVTVVKQSQLLGLRLEFDKNSGILGIIIRTTQVPNKKTINSNA